MSYIRANEFTLRKETTDYIFHAISNIHSKTGLLNFYKTVHVIHDIFSVEYITDKGVLLIQDQKGHINQGNIYDGRIQ